jgi:pyruvate-ferredoxin/flavodoxin oxidoreductase
MGDAQREMKRAVECGYWHLYRYDPRRESAGENPFTLDSKEPDWSGFGAFLSGESRYAMLRHEFPMEAERLFGEAERDCRRRYERYRKLAGGVL